MITLYYSMKQVSEKMKIPEYTLRYYEKEGLLPAIRRSRGGIRRFTEEDLEWLGLVFCLKGTGMPIKRIREFIELSGQGDQTLPQRCEILLAHKRDVENRIASMKTQLDKVNQKIHCFSSQCNRLPGVKK